MLLSTTTTAPTRRHPALPENAVSVAVNHKNSVEPLMALSTTTAAPTRRHTASPGNAVSVDLNRENSVEPPLPNCVERSLMTLIEHCEQIREHQMKSGTVSPKLSSPEHLKDQYSILRNRIRIEGLNSMPDLPSLEDLLGGKQMSKQLGMWKKALHHVRPLDVQATVRLIRQADQATNSIDGKDVILLLGATGAGKSTAIHFLAGSRLEKMKVKGNRYCVRDDWCPNSEHSPRNTDSTCTFYFDIFFISLQQILEHTRNQTYARTPPGKRHIGVATPLTRRDGTLHPPATARALTAVTTSPLARSETRAIRAVPVHGHAAASPFILCDSPGFGDKGGAEVDVANSIGVLRAVCSARFGFRILLVGISHHVHLLVGCNVHCSNPSLPVRCDQVCKNSGDHEPGFSRRQRRHDCF